MNSGAKQDTKDFTVAIIGGGICGLALAIALEKKGISTQIFEAAHKFEQVGAGFGLGPNATRVLASIGVLDPVLAKLGDSDPSFQPLTFMSGLEGHQVIYDYSDTNNTPGVGLHRAVFLDALLPLVNLNTIHFNKRCTSVAIPSEPSERTIIHFTDGTAYEADVIIGADGVKSTVRTAVAGPNKIVFGNAYAHRAVIPLEDLQAAGVDPALLDRPYNFLGKDNNLIFYPMKVNGKVLYNFAAYSGNYDSPIGSVVLPPDHPNSSSREFVLELYGGWGSNIVKIFKCAPSILMRWSIYVIGPPLETYVKGRVALVGDAAHAMLAHLGAGASQGIEDIFVLSELLAHPQTRKSNLDAVLQAYDRVRRPRSQMVSRISTSAGEVYHGIGKSGVTVETTREQLKEIWEPVWNHELGGDIEAAVSWLEETAAFPGSKVPVSSFRGIST